MLVASSPLGGTLKAESVCLSSSFSEWELSAVGKDAAPRMESSGTLEPGVKGISGTGRLRKLVTGREMGLAD